jgi:hypothetical protein
MQRRTFLGLALTLAAAAGIVVAQEKQDKVSGRVNDFNKDTMTITMHTQDSPGVKRNVQYDASTKFTLDGKEGKAEDTKATYRIVAHGKFDGANLKATQVDLFTR